MQNHGLRTLRSAGCGLVGPGLFQTRLQGINVLKQIIVDALPERVKDELHTFAACQLGGGNKVAVTRHQNDGAGLLFQGEAGDVNGDAHVHTFLAQSQANVARLDALPKLVDLPKLPGLVRTELKLKGLLAVTLGQLLLQRLQRRQGLASLESRFSQARGKCPVMVAVDLSQSQRQLALFAEGRVMHPAPVEWEQHRPGTEMPYRQKSPALIAQKHTLPWATTIIIKTLRPINWI